MLRHIHVEQTLFSPGDNVKQAQKDLIWWLYALTQRNQDYLLQHPKTPRLYKSGVKYAVPKQFNGDCEEVAILKRALGRAARHRDVDRVLDRIQSVFGGEHFCDIGVILELGEIDCDGISSWRAAELRQAGIKANPYMTSRKRLDGGTTYHALVLWPPIPGCDYETSEDPSLLLGMGGEKRKKDREIEIQKNRERCDLLRAARGGKPVPVLPKADFDVDDALFDVLGLRGPKRNVSDSFSMLDELLRIAA